MCSATSIVWPRPKADVEAWLRNLSGSEDLQSRTQEIMTENLLEFESHFSFGENWAEYAQKIDERRIEEAEKSLIRLLGREAIEGKTVIDIGCGSGLFSLA